MADANTRDGATSPNRDGWQPIETAPLDGSDVAVFVTESGEQFIAYYDAGSWIYGLIPLGRGGGKLCCEPTHWQPLLEPPVIP
jgi:hypothetical protein